MTNTQLYLAIGVPFFAVLIGLLFNHTRINDMRDLLRAEIQGSRSEILAEIRGIRQFLDVMMSKIDDMDRRITRLEERG